jgi:hypothetical protein
LVLLVETGRGGSVWTLAVLEKPELVTASLSIFAKGAKGADEDQGNSQQDQENAA